MERYTVPSLARAFEMLDMLSMSSVGLTKMEIARQIGIPYSTAFNILTTMEHHGYVRKDEASGRYYLGLKLLSFGNIGIKDVSLRDIAAPVLEDLVRKTGLTAHLAILDRGEAVYIDKKEPDGFLKINSWVGKRNYVHTSAVGKALIATSDIEELRHLWNAGLPRRTANTITSWKRFKAELIAVRKQGYAVDREEDELGGRCVSAPVLDAQGMAVAAVGLSGIVSQLPEERIPGLGEALRSATSVISSRLGHNAVPPVNGTGGDHTARRPRTR
ncbi:MAG TPA: IclR family transcriptional regulator [Bryobacteraceae bacterium]|nr:IclR family transcriptional regulator [Bryobacteraceae bacterium]